MKNGIVVYKLKLPEVMSKLHPWVRVSFLHLVKGLNAPEENDGWQDLLLGLLMLWIIILKDWKERSAFLPG